jgi:VWFA-related protein
MRRAFAALISALVLLAQEPLTISVSTRLVEVDVVVRDDNGPIKNLSKDDFTVFDRGKRQKIATFAVHSSNDAPTRALDPHPEIPGAVTNRVPGSGATIVLFDMLNTADQEFGKPSAPQSVARIQLLKFLKTLKPSERESFALFTLLTDVRVLQPFTTDPQQLVDAAERLVPEHSANQGAQDVGDEILSQAPDLHDAIANAMYVNAIREMQDNARVNRAWDTVNSMRALAKRLEGIPGRKKLIWLSSSFPASTFDIRSRNKMDLIETQDFGSPIQLAIRALNDANVAVYPLDPRDPYNAGLGADGIDTMNLMAAGTGGKAFYNLGDFSEAIRAAVDDTQVTYSLGFYPSDLQPDGSYHDLSVDVARRGVEVRARKGYFAPDAKPAGEKEKTKALREALSSPVSSADLALSVRATRNGKKPGAYDIEVTFDPHEVHLARENNNWVGLLQLIVYAPRAKKPNAHQDAIKLTLTEFRLREVLTQGRYTIRQPLPFPGNQAQEFRIALADRVTGATGSVQLHLNQQ